MGHSVDHPGDLTEDPAGGAAGRAERRGELHQRGTLAKLNPKIVHPEPVTAQSLWTTTNARVVVHRGAPLRRLALNAQPAIAVPPNKTEHGGGHEDRDCHECAFHARVQPCPYTVSSPDASKVFPRSKRQQQGEDAVAVVRGLRRRELLRVAVADLLGLADVGDGAHRHRHRHPAGQRRVQSAPMTTISSAITHTTSRKVRRGW
nr:hypothetical protein GCM10010200_050300 [Actinomadura rugatobispora]